jgi:hypothetical protein
MTSDDVYYQEVHEKVRNIVGVETEAAVKAAIRDTVQKEVEAAMMRLVEIILEQLERQRVAEVCQ